LNIYFSRKIEIKAKQNIFFRRGRQGLTSLLRISFRDEESGLRSSMFENCLFENLIFLIFENFIYLLILEKFSVFKS